MMAQMEASTMDSKSKGLYKVGGASLMLNGVLLIAIFGTVLAGPQPPTDPAQYLKTFATSSLNLLETALLFALAILLVPGILGLYGTLKQANKTWMLLATGFFFLGIGALFVATTAAVTSVFLSQSYSSASNATLQAYYIAGAAATIALGNSAGFIAGFIISLGILLIGMTMLKSVFGKPLAYLSVVTGLVGSVGSATFYLPLVIPYFLLYVVWLLWTGFKLWKMG